MPLIVTFKIPIERLTYACFELRFLLRNSS